MSVGMRPTEPSREEVEPPSFREFSEAAFQAPLRPRHVFGNMRNLPAPSYAIMLGNVLFWWLSGFAIAVAPGVARSPFLPNGLWMGICLLLVAPFLVAGFTALSFASAWMLHALALLSGGRGKFKRAYEIVALTGAMLPIGALTFVHPALGTAAFVYLVAVNVRAVSLMYFAPMLRSALVFGAAGLSSLSLLWVASSKLGTAGERPMWALRAGLATMRPAASGLGPGGFSQMGVAAKDAARTPPPASGPAGPADQTASQVSGLELIRGPYAGEADARPEGRLRTQDGGSTSEKMLRMQQKGFGMIENLQRAAKDPRFFRNMPPQQAHNTRQLLRVADDVSRLYRARSQDGKKAAGLSDAEAAEIMRQVQQIVPGLDLSAVLRAAPAGSTQASPPTGDR